MMGVINHNVIMATTWSDEIFHSMLNWLDINCSQFSIIHSKSIMNGYHTFVIMPHGSKEGWDTSDNCELMRDILVDKLSDYNYEDNSSPWEWVEVSYGDCGQNIIRGNNVNKVH